MQVVVADVRNVKKENEIKQKSQPNINEQRVIVTRKIRMIENLNIPPVFSHPGSANVREQYKHSNRGNLRGA